MARRLQNLEPESWNLGETVTIDTMDSLARLAGALSLLASWKMRPRRRVREKVARDASSSARVRAATQGPDAPWRRWADAFIGVLWAALLLFVLGYVALRGDAVITELDGIVLATPYSMEP
jgi:ABC-type Fe3+ transport system permease subunit